MLLGGGTCHLAEGGRCEQLFTLFWSIFTLVCLSSLASTLRARIWEQVVPQIHPTGSAKIPPVSDARRLHPAGAALHVAVTEPPAVPVYDPRPRRRRRRSTPAVSPQVPLERPGSPLSQPTSIGNPRPRAASLNPACSAAFDPSRFDEPLCSQSSTTTSEEQFVASAPLVSRLWQ